jgi:hypothetical protein
MIRRVSFQRMRQSLAFFGCLLLMPALPERLAAEATRLAVRNHPNHFIFLVDASGSTASNRRKALLYRRALSTAADLLFAGAGAAVPAFDPARDRITLHHFGIVDQGEASTAYLRLRQYDLASALIHPQFLHRGAVTHEELASALFPRVFYRLTISHWAEELALDASRPKTPDLVAERTFLWKIDDRSPNEGSPEQEEEFVHSWGERTSYQAARARVEAVRRGYEWPKVLERTVQDGPAATVFLAVYEVKPRLRDDWERRLAHLQPFSAARLRWTSEEAQRAGGELAVSLASELPRLLAGASATLEAAGSGLRGARSWRLAEGPAMTLAVERPGRLPCAPQPVDIALRAAPRLGDALVGTAIYDYVARQALLAPPPGRCGLLRRLAMTTLWALAGAVVLLAALAVVLRSFATPLWAKLPGMSRLVALGWGGPVEQRSTLTVNPGSQLVRFHLPPFLVQLLAYPGAKLRVQGPVAGSLRWSHSDGTAPVQLPLRARTVSLLWRTDAIAGDGWTEISLTTGSRMARLILGPVSRGGEARR